jgi:osmotically inducible lipoprotein OsmB
MDIDTLKTSLALCALLGLSACGDTLGEQALLGGAAGAGTAVVTNNDPLTGAAVGAAANVAYCQTYPERC